MNPAPGGSGGRSPRPLTYTACGTARPGSRRPGYAEETTDCWFDEPEPGDRRSWAVPAAHGIYQELDLQLLDPGDENERALLIEALHPEFADALQGDGDVIIDGEPVNPRLHVAMHQVVANQLLADDPRQTWQTVQRLAGSGYDWHTIMHMIASLVAEDVSGVLQEQRKPDPAAYARRLNEVPGDWPPTETARRAPGSAAVRRWRHSRFAACPVVPPSDKGRPARVHRSRASRTLTRRIGQDWMKASRSALIVGAWVVGMPWGNPW
jgi:Domain of unknown function (DUF1841)